MSNTHVSLKKSIAVCKSTKTIYKCTKGHFKNFVENEIKTKAAFGTWDPETHASTFAETAHAKKKKALISNIFTPT